MLRILFVTSEAHPLIKTGGLADVCGTLPPELTELGAEVRLLLPAYRDAVAVAGNLKPMAHIDIPWIGGSVRLLEGTLPGTRAPLWLIDYPPAYDRPGNPYLDEHGRPWYDNAARFGLLAYCAAALAQGRGGVSWRPDVVHCHDWQAGLTPALLTRESTRPATVFTIHNLSYQGLFPADTFSALHLPAPLWALDGLEFYGQLSFIKGGIVFADRVTTVSPTYAREIQTAEFGDGLDGLLRHRASALSGILNGIDERTWNPVHDRFLVKPYSARHLDAKTENKQVLQQAFGLPENPAVPLIGMVGRLVSQKGIDLVLAALPALARVSVQLVILGHGDHRYEQALDSAAARYPGWLAVRIGYDEALAHGIEAGADMFLMPSRFEPCGLNQMYSLRYGTVPIVRRVGGLADTVIDAMPAQLRAGTATGIVFDAADPAALGVAVDRALALFRDRAAWRRLALTGMRQDFSWKRSAAEYLKLYETVLGAHSSH